MISFSLAPSMHRLRENANSLMFITVLLAMTLTMFVDYYSLYYSTERETQVRMPFDFMFEENEVFANKISNKMNEKEIFQRSETMEMLMLSGKFQERTFSVPIHELEIAILSD